MIRNLKILTAAAMALTAFGVLGASSAQAAEFHCSVEPCQVTMKPDGTGKTAHHVIFLSNETGYFQTTCGSITGEGTMSGKTSSELTIGNIKGEGCTIAGMFSTLTSNGCHYLLKAAGTLTISCPAGKEIENSGLCSYNIPPQGPLAGVTYHNVGSSEVTAELKVKNMVMNASGMGCPWGPATGEFVTANILLTGETDPGGEMANLWLE